MRFVPEYVARENLFVGVDPFGDGAGWNGAADAPARWRAAL